MKKLCFSLILLASFTAIVNAQQTINDPNAVKVEVGSFHAIDVATGIQLFLVSGTIDEVAVSAATTEFRDHIVAKVENGVLKLYYESKLKAINKKKVNKELKAYVSCRQLDGLYASTGALVKIQSVLKMPALEIKASTGAQVNGEVDSKSLTVKQSTGSQVNLSGKSESLQVEGDTGSKFKGEEMTSQTCNISVSTGAQVTVDAEKEMVVKANTGGLVKYKGNASVREVKTSTGGTLRRI
jgi:hypothetical protein